MIFAITLAVIAFLFLMSAIGLFVGVVLENDGGIMVGLIFSGLFAFLFMVFTAIGFACL